MRKTTGDTPQSDALVLFGISGDLARKKIFPALYGMAKRGVLNVPVVGVATSRWSPAQLRGHAEDGIREAGKIDDRPALRHLLSLLRYVSGNYNDAATFKALKTTLGDARRPAFYLTIPPALFTTVIKALAAAGPTDGARVIVEKPFGCDLASARELNRDRRRGDGPAEAATAAMSGCSATRWQATARFSRARTWWRPLGPWSTRCSATTIGRFPTGGIAGDRRTPSRSPRRTAAGRIR